MLKKLDLVLMAFVLISAMPVLAAENCDVKRDTKEAVNECVLKTKPIEHKIERINGESDKVSTNNSTKDQKKLKKEAKEDNDILEELSKQ